jgi:hypothetical protein
MDVLNAKEGMMKKSKDTVPTEEQDQIRLAVWLTKQGIRFTASANGGKRSLIEAIKFKRMGVSKGWPDISIPYVRKPYYGLYIELKRVCGGVVSTEQRDWLDFLKSQGYYAEVAKGFDEAKIIIEKYMGLW